MDVAPEDEASIVCMKTISVDWQWQVTSESHEMTNPPLGVC